MAADQDQGQVTLPARKERKGGALQTMCKLKPMAKTQNQNDPIVESFESGGSASSETRTWMASDACEEGCSGGSGSGSGSDGGTVDRDPGSLRLRSLLNAAGRARSPSGSGSLTSSCCDGEIESESENESEGKESREALEEPPRFVARAASARRFMDRARASSVDSSIAPVGAGAAGARDKADAYAADQDTDVEGAAALAAALEAVLLCPPQVLARSTSCEGQGSFLSSLLTPTSELSPSDGGDDHSCSRGWAAGGDGEAEDAVKAALAWSFPVPKLPSVVEEAAQEGESTDRRTVSKEWDIVTSSAPGSRSNAMPESVEAAAAAAAEGGSSASDSAVVFTGHREAFPVADGKERRRTSATSISSGDPDAATLPPSPVLAGQLSATAPSNDCNNPAASDASPAAASSDDSLTVTPTQSGDGFAPCAISHEGSATQGGVVYSKTAADDDDSGSVQDGDGGASDGTGGKHSRSSLGSAAGSAPSDRLGHQRSRWGSMNMGEFSLEDAPPSATALAQERETLLLSVFGRHAGTAELATVGRSNSCHVFLEAAGRIAALPALERSLLTELDRASDDEDGGGGGDGDCGVDGHGYGDVASRPRAIEIATSSQGSAAASAAIRELPLLRVGCGEAEAEAEAGRDTAAPTTAYRYRRLAGNSGRGWPPEVDPARREEWLCPIEFEAVFGMKFAEFRELPSWKRVLLKQEVHLF